MKASRLAAVWGIVALADARDRLTAQAASLTGTVVMATGGKPLAAAEVSLVSLGISTRSDSTGHLQLSAIPAGTQEVTVRAIGFQLLNAKIALQPSEEARATFQLKSNASLLDTVNVGGTGDSRWARLLADFEQRRHTCTGVLLAHDKLEKKYLDK